MRQNSLQILEEGIFEVYIDHQNHVLIQEEKYKLEKILLKLPYNHKIIQRY